MLVHGQGGLRSFGKGKALTPRLQPPASQVDVIGNGRRVGREVVLRDAGENAVELKEPRHQPTACAKSTPLLNIAPLMEIL